MKSKLYILGLMLILSALIVSGCGTTTAQPTEVPTDTRTGEAVEAPEGVRDALDAALAYFSANYGDEAPAPGLTWMGENITPGWPEAPVPGWVEYQYTAEDWVITIGHAVLPPEWTIYQVTVTNPTTGFQWEGEVDAAGQAAELLAPEEVRTARAVALGYVSQHYGEQADPGRGVVWMEERTTPEGLVGSETYEFTTGDWVVTISYPVVAPENVVYQVVMANQATGFQWEGDVDAAWQVTETLAPSDVQPVVQPPEPGRALDAALAYVREHYGEQAPSPGLTWVGDHPPAEEPVGVQTFEFTPGSGAEDWVIAVSYPVVAPEDVVYRVVVTNETTGFRWEGEVDAGGEVTEILAPITEQLALCWYGRVESTPGDAALDRYLVLLPKEARRAVDAVGADEVVEAEIEALRDSGIYAHFWGTLDCDVPGWGGCQLVVTRLRPEGPEGPFFDPDPVEGWTGSVFSTPDDAQFDDYFVLSSNFHPHYGIESADAAIAAQLESLRDTGSIVRVWGQVTCPAIDFYGTQIQVTRIEVVMEAPAAGDEYEGWKPYLNERFGYALMYPSECRVMGTNLDDAVQFAGQEWPVLTVRHYDSDFYHPPAGTDVRQWIADRDMTYDEIDLEAEIAGLPMVHLIHEEGPGWDASDEYYFIRGDQLFSILILHTGGQQDWELYNKFLQSFTLP